MTPAKNCLTSLQEAGISCELRIDASAGQYPYFTFSELCLVKDENYDRAISLIFKTR
jgi:hypothetical protein